VGLQALRLIGASTDARWPVGSFTLEGSPADYTAGASWLKEQLHGARSSDQLETLCLDVEGTLFSWVTAAGDNKNIASIARQGSLGGHADLDPSATPAQSLVEFFAPDDLDSSIQALNVGHDDAAPGVAVAAKPGRAGSASLEAPLPAQRTPVLATADLPGRLLIDALDREGVAVGGACTLWHALAQAWDTPPSPATRPDLVAIVLVDPVSARLVWCWSQGASLRAGGSMLLRSAIADEAPMVLLTADDAARLSSDWVAWAVQLGVSPSRIVAVLPDQSAGLSAPAFGQAIGSSCSGIPIDAGTYEDPLGSTIRRFAGVLEKTPAATRPDAGSSLVALSTRPRSAHKWMYIWSAIAVGAASLAMLAVGWRYRTAAEENKQLAAEWSQAWREPVEAVYPQALTPGLSESELGLINSEIKKRQKAMRPANAEAPLPVLQELETVSFALAEPDVEVDEIDLNSSTLPRITVLVPSTARAEALVESLRRIGGSNITEWSANIQDAGQGEKRRVTMTGKWIKPASTAGGKP
jgi:hypothetical protein